MADFYSSTDDGLRTSIVIENSEGRKVKMKVLVTVNQRRYFSSRWPFYHKEKYWNIAYTNPAGWTINIESDDYPVASTLEKRYHDDGESLINALKLM